MEPLPGFRNIVVREYVALDYERVVRALERLEQPQTRLLGRILAK